MVHAEHEEYREKGPIDTPMETNWFGRIVIGSVSGCTRVGIDNGDQRGTGHEPVKPSVGLKAHPVASEGSESPYDFNVIITQNFRTRP